jgi:hypothetical protein
LQHSQQDDDGARDSYEGAPLPVDKPAHGRDAHTQGHERRGEPEVENGGLCEEILARLEGIGEEGRQQEGATRAEEGEDPSDERRQVRDLKHLRPS